MVLWLTVKRPLTVPVSAASLVAVISTVAESLSRMEIVASSLAASMVMPGSALMPVKVTITVSSASTMLSSMMPVTSMNASVAPSGMVTLPLSVV